MAAFDPNEMQLIPPRGPETRKQPPGTAMPSVPTFDKAAPEADPNKMVLSPPGSGGETNRPKPAVSPALDFGRQLLQGSARGAQVLHLPRSLASLESVAVADFPALLRNLDVWEAKAKGTISPAKAESIRQSYYELPVVAAARRKGYLPPLTPEQSAGLRSPIFNALTLKGEEERLAQAAKEGKVGLFGEFKPEGRAGTIGGAIGESIVPSAIGPARGLASRVIAGGAGAGAGKFIEEQYPGNAWAPIIATLGGGYLAEKTLVPAMAATGRIFAPGTTAERELISAISVDLANNPALREKALAARQSGTPLQLLDVMGPRAQELFRKKGFADADIQNIIDRTKPQLEARANQGPTRAVDFMTSRYGVQNAGELTDLAKEAGRLERTRVYDYARNQAAGIPISLGDLDPSLIRRPVFKQAMDQANIVSDNMPQYGMLVPAPYRQHIYPSGRVITGRSNLQYMDQVKRELEAIARADPSQAVAAMDARDTLLKTLDSKFPDYPVARGVASATFAAQNAPEAGLNFYKKADQFAVNDIKKAISSYGPDQADLFARGFMTGVTADMAKGNFKGLYTNFFRNPDFQERAMLALGPQRYNEIAGKVAAEQLLLTSGVPNLNPTGYVQNMAKIGGFTGVGSMALDSLMNMAMFSGNPIEMQKALGAAVAGAFAGALKTKGDQAVGRELVRLALSDSAGSREQLAKLLSQSSIRRTYEQMMAYRTPATAYLTQAAGRAIEGGGNQYPDYEEAQRRAKAGPEGRADEAINEAVRQGVRELLGMPRFTGGRVGRAAGGRIGSINHAAKAAALVRRAEQAKRQHSSQTEVILDQPDTVVAKALAKANDAI